MCGRMMICPTLIRSLARVVLRVLDLLLYDGLHRGWDVSLTVLHPVVGIYFGNFPESFKPIAMAAKRSVWRIVIILSSVVSSLGSLRATSSSLSIVASGAAFIESDVHTLTVLLSINLCAVLFVLQSELGNAVQNLVLDTIESFEN